MRPPTFIDTGPLVALLNGRDRHHAWAVAQAAALPPPLLTCEAVIAEACWLLRGFPRGPARVLALLSRDALRIGFDLESEADPVAALLARHANVPMDLADACLVRMTELMPAGRVLTLDADFLVYRRLARRVVPTIMP